MDGEAGPTEIDDSVGFTKKPRQLAAKAIVASTAKAPIKRTFGVLEDILVATPWARSLRCSGIVQCFGYKNCSREEFQRRTRWCCARSARNHLSHFPPTPVERRCRSALQTK